MTSYIAFPSVTHSQILKTFLHILCNRTNIMCHTVGKLPENQEMVETVSLYRLTLKATEGLILIYI